MFYYGRTDISEGIDPAKSNDSKECMIRHHCRFSHAFDFQDYVCNGCDFATFTVKEFNYICVIHDRSRSRGLQKGGVFYSILGNKENFRFQAVSKYQNNVQVFDEIFAFVFSHFLYFYM